MTGVNEMRSVRLVSAAPEQIRVSVLGEGTQLDVDLPHDVPVAAFLPELAVLIGSRAAPRDEDLAARDERRTFWVLSRVDDGAELTPGESLRTAGVSSGELLRISAKRALSQPTLYDDVVDAAARLNRAAYAPWNARAAAVMAFAGVWACTALWVLLLLSDAVSPHRGAVITGAVLMAVTLAGGSAIAYRALGFTAVGAAVGWHAIVLMAAVGWVSASTYGPMAIAATCAVLLVLTGAYQRVVGTAPWMGIAAAVVFGFGTAASLCRGLGASAEVTAVAAATLALLGCLSATRVKIVRRSPRQAVEPVAAQEAHTFANPFTPAPATSNDADELPSAEEVWAGVRSAALARAGLLGGLAVVAIVGAAVLLRTNIGWPAVAFGLVCSSVLALQTRRVDTAAERATLGVSALTAVLSVGVLAQSGAVALSLVGVLLLVAVAAVAIMVGLTVGKGKRYRRIRTAVAYLDYLTVAAILPTALWPLGFYEWVGPW